MKFSVIIQPIHDEVTAKLVARNIASRSQGVSFSELTEILQNEEFTYAKNIDKYELEQYKHTLDDQGVHYTVISHSEDEKKFEKREEKAPPVEKPERTIAPKKSITPVSTVEKAPQKRAKVIVPATLSLIFITTVLIIALVQNNTKEKRFSISSGTISKSGPTTKNHTPETEPNNAAPGSQESQSRIYSDSADQKCGHSGHDAERLYRFAISYNERNIDAWFGLLNCYRSTDKERSAQEVEHEMKRIFGPAVLLPEEFTQKFGTTEVMQIKDGSASFVYKTERAITDIYSDLFQITRRFSSLGKYHTLTVLAKRADGSGIFMTVTLGNCVTYRDFINSGSFEELK